MRAYYRIADPAVRKRLFELTKALANLARQRGPCRSAERTPWRCASHPLDRTLYISGTRLPANLTVTLAT